LDLDFFFDRFVVQESISFYKYHDLDLDFFFFFFLDCIFCCLENIFFFCQVTYCIYYFYDNLDLDFFFFFFYLDCIFCCLDYIFFLDCIFFLNLLRSFSFLFLHPNLLLIFYHPWCCSHTMKFRKTRNLLFQKPSLRHFCF
jgi:hypothetical protein